MGLCDCSAVEDKAIIEAHCILSVGQSDATSSSTFECRRNVSLIRTKNMATRPNLNCVHMSNCVLDCKVLSLAILTFSRTSALECTGSLEHPLNKTHHVVRPERRWLLPRLHSFTFSLTKPITNWSRNPSVLHCHCHFVAPASYGATH